MTYAGRHGAADDTSPSAEDMRAELVEAAQAWVDDDPDHDPRVELGDVIARAKAGDGDAVAGDRFRSVRRRCPRATGWPRPRMRLGTLSR